MKPVVRGIWLDYNTHLALLEYAWLKRTTMSEVLRTVLDHVAQSEPDDSVLSTPDRPGRKRMNVKTTDEQWDAAAAAAVRAGVGFHSLIRRHLIKVLMEEGLLE